MNWELIIDDSARKRLRRIPGTDATKIMAVIDKLTVNPYGGDIEKMEGGENVWRRRAGNYRIFYEIYISKKIIYIFDIKRRTSNTY